MLRGRIGFDSELCWARTRTQGLEGRYLDAWPGREARLGGGTRRGAAPVPGRVGNLRELRHDDGAATAARRAVRPPRSRTGSRPARQQVARAW
jgi:hypothetical protein